VILFGTRDLPLKGDLGFELEELRIEFLRQH
jgi:hypothetical protein